ncbi:hypothetical protein CCHOA_03585 [Corynebacterium choanae]|uniref:Uncharacterized protein n=1 Tax=Corynebacterium choanae TaxID=1862358 RepID=A0A3G6J8A3_9CORY|nr:hypothetical protein CCHOA_03585 [Corynebacterium choanae]
MCYAATVLLCVFGLVVARGHLIAVSSSRHCCSCCLLLLMLLVECLGRRGQVYCGRCLGVAPVDGSDNTGGTAAVGGWQV